MQQVNLLGFVMFNVLVAIVVGIIVETAFWKLRNSIKALKKKVEDPLIDQEQWEQEFKTPFFRLFSPSSGCVGCCIWMGWVMAYVLIWTLIGQCFENTLAAILGVEVPLGIGFSFVHIWMITSVLAYFRITYTLAELDNVKTAIKYKFFHETIEHIMNEGDTAKKDRSS